MLLPEAGSRLEDMKQLPCEECHSRKTLCPFRGLNPIPLRGHIPRIELYEGSSLWCEGSPSLGCYLICRGVIQISKYAPNGREQLLEFLGPGELVGLNSLFMGSARSTSALALKRCELIWLDKGEFLDFMRLHSVFSTKVLQQLGERLDRMQQRYQLACHGGVRERLIWELL